MLKKLLVLSVYYWAPLQGVLLSTLAMLYIFLVSSVLESFLQLIQYLLAVICQTDVGFDCLVKLSVEVVSYFVSGCWLLIVLVLSWVVVAGSWCRGGRLSGVGY